MLADINSSAFVGQTPLHYAIHPMTPSMPACVPTTQTPYAIDNNQLVLKELLGVGAYGSVHKAVHAQTGHIFAVKSLNKSGLNPRQRAFQNHEAKLHALVSGHPNIATLHKIVEEDDCLHMVLDCGVEGDLFYAITEKGGFVGNVSAIKAIFSQIASAVMHCHSRGVYHRDLKPENIIIYGPSVKLVDFGLATTDPISSDFGCGSTFYLSPECQGGYQDVVKSYDSAANDVWSLGVILINLVFGRNPWKQACARDETFSAYVANNNFLQTILPMSGELNEIIKSVFCLTPSKRITLPELAARVQACRSFSAPEFLSIPASWVAASAPVVPDGVVVNIAAKTAQASSVATAARRADDTLFNNGDKEDSGVDLRSLA